MTCKNCGKPLDDEPKLWVARTKLENVPAGASDQIVCRRRLLLCLPCCKEKFKDFVEPN
jgi:hypothetical protein